MKYIISVSVLQGFTRLAIFPCDNSYSKLSKFWLKLVKQYKTSELDLVIVNLQKWNIYKST